MAGDWIKVRTSLPNDGRVRIAAKALMKSNALGNATTNAYSVTVFGALVTLWCFADVQANENGVLVGYDFSDINDLVGIPKFCESLPNDWISLEGEWVKLPDYQEHNGKSSKKRAQTAKRVANAKANAKSVTSLTQGALPSALPREEKRREENIKDIKKNIKKKTPSAKSKKFIKPTVKQIADYCTERNNTINPEYFFDQNESKGWVVGKSPMKDWKAAIRTWERNGFNNPKSQIDDNDSKWLEEIQPDLQRIHEASQ